MTAAEIILDGLRVWGIVGAIVAAVFLTIGIDRIDEDARGAYFFRPLLIPGVLVIWPLVLWRWYVYETNSEQWKRRYDPPRRVHFAVGLVMPVAIVVVIATGLSSRQEWPSHIAPEKLAPPAEIVQ